MAKKKKRGKDVKEQVQDIPGCKIFQHLTEDAIEEFHIDSEETCDGIKLVNTLVQTQLHKRGCRTHTLTSKTNSDRRWRTRKTTAEKEV